MVHTVLPDVTYFPHSPKEEQWPSNCMGQVLLQIRLFHLQWNVRKEIL